MKVRTPNILRGMGSVLDIFPVQNYSELLPEIDLDDPFNRDAENLCGDWFRVGDSIAQAMTKYDSKEE